MKNTGIENLIVRANNGDGQACYDLYKEYKNGIHVAENELTAMDWLEKALDCNHPMAQLIMGLSLLNAGQQKDAIQYLQLASSNGNPDAMNVLGQLYLGNVENMTDEYTDEDKGLQLLYQAAFCGSPNAQVMLGKCYYIGKWVHQDKLMAKYWLEKAMNAGSEEAAHLYEEALRVNTLLN
mgnify:FL=1